MEKLVIKEEQIGNKRCDGEDCQAEGTKEIKIPAGRFRLLTLRVCPNCVGKFLD